MKKNKTRIVQKIAQRRAKKEKKRRKNKQINKPTSIREIHVSKSDEEQKTYLSYLDGEFGVSNDDEPLEGVKEKEFEENKITSNIPATDSEVSDRETTGGHPYSKERDNKDDEEENWLCRLWRYWVRNYPELIIKEILIKIISTIIIAILFFIGGFYYKGSISDKKIEELRDEMNGQILEIQQNNATTEKIFTDLFNEKIKEINQGIEDEIENRLNIIEAINDIGVNTESKKE